MEFVVTTHIQKNLDYVSEKTPMVGSFLVVIVRRHPHIHLYRLAHDDCFWDNSLNDISIKRSCDPTRELLPVAHQQQCADCYDQLLMLCEYWG